ncbi:MAG: hypothetical protein LAT68_09430 [Cyclobacteriaceae bacterium]|nr:hypothetical protein [Cyclobacteriaceae bacterium]MCH8516535.1 hypothetical protein [Cyclobacteriaceae bacterium]
MDKEKSSAQDNNKKSDKDVDSWRDYFDFGEVLGYFFRKKDPSRPSSFNLKMMHGINKISIIMFLLGLIFIIFKFFVFQ